MKLQRFFVGSTFEANRLNAPIRTPSLELLHQLKKVFRYVPGDQVILFDNSGYQYLAAIHSYDNESVSFTILEKQENNITPKRETWLFAAVVKKDTFEWIVEKATELGVSHVIPLLTDRTEKKAINGDRLLKVSIEASEQSGRATVPEIHSILELASCLEQFKNIKSIAWEPSAEKFTPTDLIGTDPIGIYIGPEGGWTEKELGLFTKNKVQVLSLGPQVLRAETAVVAALSQVVF